MSRTLAQEEASLYKARLLSFIIK